MLWVLTWPPFLFSIRPSLHHPSTNSSAPKVTEDDGISADGYNKPYDSDNITSLWTVEMKWNQEQEQTWEQEWKQEWRWRWEWDKIEWPFQNWLGLTCPKHWQYQSHWRRGMWSDVWLTPRIHFATDQTLSWKRNARREGEPKIFWRWLH
jgi:hypothetical protein